jgi:hypothetical protein
MLETVWNVVLIVLALTGAMTWVFGALIVIFYWLCSRPHQN